MEKSVLCTALTLKSGEGQSFFWGLCLTNHLGLGERILFLELHQDLSRVTCPSKTKKSVHCPATNFCSGLCCFDSDLYWLLCLDPNFISCVCSPSSLSDITKIPCSPETLFLSLSYTQTAVCALHGAKTCMAWALLSVSLSKSPKKQWPGCPPASAMPL